MRISGEVVRDGSVQGMLDELGSFFADSDPHHHEPIGSRPAKERAVIDEFVKLLPMDDLESIVGRDAKVLDERIVNAVSDRADDLGRASSFDQSDIDYGHRGSSFVCGGTRNRAVIIERFQFHLVARPWSP